MQKKTAHTARFVATETLCNLFQRRSSVKLLFDKNIKKYNLPPGERNLAMNLIYGVLRQRQFLDTILQKRSRTPLRKLHPFVHQALAVALYQIFFLDTIPHSAAVNEAVNSCKLRGVPKRLHGFVNGVLRETVRRKEREIPAEFSSTELDCQPIFNHPAWLVNRWVKAFGEEETARICRKNSAEPLLMLRTNSTRISRKDLCHHLDRHKISNQPGEFAPDAIILPDFHGSIQSIPGYEQGFFQVQNQAAQLATLLLGPFKVGGRYLDGCAGLGGKTSHIMQLGELCKLKIYAVEPEQHRLKKLLENQHRLFQQRTLSIYQGNLREFSAECAVQFDGILIDAPCSGTGVTGRHPDIRWNRTERDLLQYQEIQLELLELAQSLLKPGGVLVYSTCSLEHEENQDVISTFLAGHPEFTLTNCAEHLPETAHKFIRDNFFSPHPASTTDGFFAARMEQA
ncbi:MAG: 16S rRNA (cytosine(967)-C(5))-methyltransferase RsmB [Deltaproteobacteria bacterium]|nr:16S rRNA (cytosine(967)-C(5))-methyltransferase RsmB [Deltaproteobacteria bacterium]